MIVLGNISFVFASETREELPVFTKSEVIERTPCDWCNVLECNSSRCNPYSMWPDLWWDGETYDYAYCTWEVTCPRDDWKLAIKLPK